MQKREKELRKGERARVSARLSAQWTDFDAREGFETLIKSVVSSVPSRTIVLNSSNSVASTISEPKTNFSKLVRARSGRDFLFSSLRT